MSGSTVAQVSPRRARFALLALALGGFTIGTTEFTTMGLLSDIASNLHVSVPTAGDAITFYAIGVVVGAPTLTIVVSRLSRKTLLLLLMSAYAVFNVLSALATTIGQLDAARFLAGLPHGAFFGAGAVVGSAIAGPGRRGRAVATMMVGLTTANIIGVPMSTFVGQHYGWRAAFVMVGVFGAVTVLMLAVLIPSGAGGGGTDPRHELRSLRNGPLWVAFIAASIGFAGLFSVYSYVEPAITQVTGLSSRVVPIVLSVIGVGMTAGMLLGGRLADRSVPRTVATGFISSAVVLAAIALFLAYPVPTIAGLFLIGVASQILGLSLQTKLMDLSPTAPSLGAALCHSALNVANAEAAYLGGVVIAAGWGYAAPAWVGVIVTVIGFVIMAPLLRSRRPRA